MTAADLRPILVEDVTDSLAYRVCDDCDREVPGEQRYHLASSVEAARDAHDPAAGRTGRCPGCILEHIRTQDLTLAPADGTAVGADVLYLELRGVSPSDLDVDKARSPPSDEATALANDVFRVAAEGHGLDIDGVATVVNPSEHERLLYGSLDCDR